MNKFTINTDGGSRGNPGPAAIGVVIEGNLVGKKKYGEYIGIATNNEAEYKAVIFALKKLKQLIGQEKAKTSEVEFMVDSELLSKQMNHEYKVKEEGIQKLFLETHNLKLDFGKVIFTHVMRGKNTHADKLLNQVLDREENKLEL
ncbi:MAG: ribonuclease HI family protein [bacterium]|nr:ribonuclease HI family protein [bacterium]